MQLSCQINNRQITQQIEPDLLLIDLIRNLGFKSVKRGCDTTNCGLCTVWVDEKPVLSCAVLAARVNNLTITTLEGLEIQARAVGKFLADQGAEQCGFCSPGFVMAAHSCLAAHAVRKREEEGRRREGEREE